MPVSGRELATLDFANLIGGPLNAVIEAQAKSAITTANFIKEVAFDKEGKVVNVDFTYNRVNDDGKDQEFTLTVPFLTMLPVPYISVSNARVEFNAKITSITESKSEDNFNTENNLSVSSGWFVSAKLNSKVSYQKKSSTSDKEERTFDMHVVVEAQNADMPAGTERILTILEQAITERKGPVTWMSLQLGESADRISFTIDSPPAEFAQAKGASYKMTNGKTYTVSSVVEEKAAEIEEVTEGDKTVSRVKTPAQPAKITFSEKLPPEVRLVKLSPPAKAS